MILLYSLAVAAATPAALPPVPAPAGEEKLVCKREEKLGSRLGAKKVCATAAEWKRKEEAAQDSLRNQR